MYEFTDIIQDAQFPSLPAEAMKWNGEYIENVISGYRTLYVKGREAFDVEISNNEVSSRDGAFYNRRRISPRVLTVGFQLLSASPEDFRAAYNRLFTKLYEEQAAVIFHDEEDYYYTGTVQTVPQPKAGQVNIVGEIEILCSDPYKYAVSETSVLSETAFEQGYDGFICNNGAYMSLKPRFEISFENDCGYLTLTNERTGAAVTIGDTGAGSRSIEEVMKKVFKKPSSITGEFSINTTNVSSFGRYQAKLQPGAGWGDPWVNGTDVTKYGAVGIRERTTAEDYGGMYGSSISYNMASAMSSAVFTWEHYLVATASMQGVHRFSLDDANGDPIVYVAYYKGPDENTKIFKCEIGVTVGDQTDTVLNQVSSVETNDYTGSGTYSGALAAPTRHGKGLGQIQFIKEDDYNVHVIVNIGGRVRYDRTFVSGTVIQNVSAVSFYSARYRKNTMFNQSRLFSWALESSDEVVYSKPIAAGDVVGIDTESGTITVNGEVRYDIGNLLNNFEGIVLSPGENRIAMTYSDWYEGRPSGTCFWRDKKL